MNPIKKLTQLKNACLNMCAYIELEFESKVFNEDLHFNDENVNYEDLKEKLTKFCTLVKDFSLFNRLESNIDYSEFFSQCDYYNEW